MQGLDRDAGSALPPIFAPPVLPADPRDAAAPSGRGEPAERAAGASEVRDAGATVAVAGGAIRSADDPSAAAKQLREAIDG